MPQQETHPYNLQEIGRIPEGTRLLIVGTAPPPRFSLPRPPHDGPKKGFDADFYYGSGSNWLWVYLEKAAGEEIFEEPCTSEASSEDTENLMRDFLRRNHFWMRDVLQIYKRKPGRETKAEDSAIDLDWVGTKFSEFLPILKENEHVSRVAFTSVTAAKWFFGKALAAEVDQKKAEFYRSRFADANKKREGKLGHTKYTDPFCTEELGDRSIVFYVLPSPSGRAAQFDPDLVNVFQAVLFQK